MKFTSKYMLVCTKSINESWQHTLSPLPETKVKFTWVVNSSSSHPHPLPPNFAISPQKQITFKYHTLWRYSNYFCKNDLHFRRILASKKKRLVLPCKKKKLDRHKIMSGVFEAWRHHVKQIGSQDFNLCTNEAKNWGLGNKHWKAGQVWCREVATWRGQLSC